MDKTKYKVFISSVQNEFDHERKMLVDYFQTDILLAPFFESFIFENNPADTKNPETIYLNKIKQADIYIGIIGTQYGFEDASGISPTEKEYDAAKAKGIPRWIYILNTNKSRHPREELFIQKLSKDVSWKFFTNTDNLKKEIIHTCFEFLKQKGRIENDDFDNALHPYCTIQDIDPALIKNFIEIAREKRNFAEKTTTPPEDVLKRLNLTRNHKIVNSALLLFSANPQQFFPAATIKCAHFHGTTIQKPIPDYKEFGGTIFQMAEQAVDFILSKISLSTGSRDNKILIDTEYEIPRAAIAEAVINALAHRDYRSKGSIQVSVFKDRIEIENPGHLPDEISLEDLKHPHASYPFNPLLANCLFLAGAIERYGTGTLEMIEKITSKGLPQPVFSSHKSFKVSLPRMLSEATTPEVGTQKYADDIRSKFGINSEQIRNKFGINVLRTLELILVKPETTALEIAAELKLNPRTIENYLAKLKENGYLERQGSKKDGRWIIIKKQSRTI